MSRLSCIVFAMFLLAGDRSLGAQQINPSIPPPPPPPEGSAAPQSASEQPIDPAIPPLPPPAEEPAAPPAPVFDPYHAQKSLEVGTFYLKKGDYDAAIDRFVEAAHDEPTLAKPWKLMGEAYEKKHEFAKAIESYKKYLEIYRSAGDAAKIRKRISELEEKTAQEASKSPPH
jgi:tetratricopeptide (TPR) repeat protein